MGVSIPQAGLEEGGMSSSEMQAMAAEEAARNQQAFLTSIANDSQPNLIHFLGRLNAKPPTINCQFEVWYSLWRDMKFFSTSITVGGIENAHASIYYGGMEVPYMLHPKMSSNEVTVEFLEDAGGENYAFWRNRLLLDSDIVRRNKAANSDSYLIVKQYENPAQARQGTWILHNFKVQAVGELEFSHDDSSITTFSVTGTITHIRYQTARLTTNKV